MDLDAALERLQVEVEEFARLSRQPKIVFEISVPVESLHDLEEPDWDEDPEQDEDEDATRRIMNDLVELMTSSEEVVEFEPWALRGVSVLARGPLYRNDSDDS